ncbi:MAG: AI-2E family transporter [Bdellovibrio sp.]|nr:AI-2E family transporter [Bdellovibrio sp.]
MIKRKIFPNDTNSTVRLLVLPLWLICLYAIGLLVSETAAFSLWLVCSFFLFVLLDPWAEYFKARKWGTGITAVVLVLSATLLTFGTVYVLGVLFSGVVTELQQSKKIFFHAFDSLTATWDGWTTNLLGSHATSTAANSVVSKVEVVHGSTFGGEWGGSILHGIGNAATIFTFALLVPILSFFILIERDGLSRVFAQAYTVPGTGHIIWQKIVTSTRAFFVGNFVLGLITFPLFAGLFWAFWVPSVFTVAALATVFNLIPFLGAVLSGFLPAVELYAHTQTFGAPLGLYGCCVGIHFIIADFVTPKLLGSQVNINATTSTIALVAWGELWGGVGLILAIPMTSLIKILFEHSQFFWLQWIAGLMSDDVETVLKVSEVEHSDE